MINILVSLVNDLCGIVTKYITAENIQALIDWVGGLIG